MDNTSHSPAPELHWKQQLPQVKDHARQLSVDFVKLRNAANGFSIAISDLRFELSVAFPQLTLEQLDALAGMVLAATLQRQTEHTND